MINEIMVSQQLANNEVFDGQWRKAFDVEVTRYYQLTRLLGHTPTINGEEPLPDAVSDSLGLSHEYPESVLFDAADDYGSQLLFSLPRLDSSRKKMISEGYRFYWDTFFGNIRIPERIGLPDGRIERLKSLENLAKSGDILASDGLFFYREHVRRFDVDEREEYFGINHFRDDEDRDQCMARYAK